MCDDGSCTTLIVTGCTDATATNYDATANQDDGSCIYTSPFVDLSLEVVDNSSSNFTNGEVTYRLYAELSSSSAKILQIFADETRPHLLETSTSFYQDAFANANLQQEVNTIFFTLPGFENVAFDSWMTIGDNYTPATLVLSLIHISEPTRPY